jgi:ABC-type cobalamin/Fe3+-siderophores transport system ATPase subunit
MSQTLVPSPISSPETHALKAVGVSFSYGSALVLDAINCELSPGRVTAIVGPNGSGKSTLLSVLLGYLAPQQGEVLLDGVSLEGFSPRRRAAAVSYVSQQPAVSFAFTVGQIVRMGTWPLRQQEHAAGSSELIHQVLQLADLEALWNRPFNELSAGEQQRVAIARALVQQSPVMLLDEPSSMLDLRHQLEMLEHFRNLAHQKQKTIGWVTHDLNHARQFADHVIVLNQGRLIASGPSPEVLTPAILEPVYGVKVRVQSNVLLFSR